VEVMKRKIILIILAFVLCLLILNGISVANNQDHNHNTNGEDNGNYYENNNNPYENDEFPGEETQKRSGIEW